MKTDKWVEGYNDGYLLGRYDTTIARIIYNALESPSNDYGQGIKLGYEIAREQAEKKRMQELGKLRGKKGREKGLDR